ncbi:Ig-like domain-containing protein [Ramlibacter albus]|uniref:Ig-like domain-containing protein n=1 Tax=Ramlibacter albus TaxID=2079448 RepID=A0A923S813_9BURK|nr:Ig-like domain-containing protein [Ramlibacter albus]MBC5767647.1 Ig-like domain-containing protein [Ramlibacter albus]
MKKRQFMSVVFATILSAVAFLTACGGGGGGGGGTTDVTTSTPTTTTPVPATQTGPKAAMYQYIDSFRANGGFGSLTSDGRVENAAQAHSNYLTTNFYANGVPDPILFTLTSAGLPFAHYEEATRPGFTGAVPDDRLRAAGYVPTRSSEVSGSQFGAAAGADPDTKGCVDQLIGTVFHRAALLDTTMDSIGVGIGSAVRDGNGFLLRNCVINLASQSAVRVLPSGWIGITPYAGQIGIATKMSPEVPDPTPTIAVEGYPISIQIAPEFSLAVDTFSVSDGSGSQVPGLVVTRAQSTLLRANEAYFVPNGALRPNTTYTVSFAGRASPVQGAAGAWVPIKTWTFTTGAQ